MPATTVAGQMSPNDRLPYRVWAGLDVANRRPQAEAIPPVSYLKSVSSTAFGSSSFDRGRSKVGGDHEVFELVHTFQLLRQDDRHPGSSSIFVAFGGVLG
ncbi:MAG: hypothetical protein ACKVP0_06740 [Pirellulaceae bacterium]